VKSAGDGRTRQCPVRRHVILSLGLGAGRPLEALSSCGTDSPVPHRTVRCAFDLLLWLLPRYCDALFIRQSRPLRAYSRCSAGAPNSPVVHRTVRWIIAELRLGNLKLRSLSWFTLVHRTLSGGTPDSPVRQTRAHLGFLFAPFFWSLSCFFYWFVLNLWHL
jgi:hypothetical protein